MHPKLLLANTYMKMDGWTVEGEVPAGLKKAVLIAAPHTSNWDLPLMLFTAIKMDVNLSWLGKHTLFDGAFSGFFENLGGIPVDRRSRNNVVQQIADEFGKRDELFLAISPEGTRKHTEYWKSGFYHIARTAGVPILLSFLDYKRKRSGLGPAVDSSRSAREVMDDIRAFYEGMEGYREEDFGPIRLKEEAED